jgi:hypothetical protein
MQVRVLGSCVALGDFEVDKAVRLCTTDDAYPVWSAETPVVVTRGYPITYRCRLFVASHSAPPVGPHICHTVPTYPVPTVPTSVLTYRHPNDAAHARPLYRHLNPGSTRRKVAAQFAAFIVWGLWATLGDVWSLPCDPMFAVKLEQCLP